MMDRAESGKGGSNAEVCRRDAHEPRVPVPYCHRNGFRSTAPAVGQTAYSPQKILHSGDYPDNFLELSALVDSRRLISGQDHENSLAGLPNAAQVAPRVRGKLFGGRPGVGSGFLDHRRFELVEPGKNESGTTDPVFSTGRQDHSGSDQLT